MDGGPLLGGGGAQADEQVRLAGAGVADQAERLAGTQAFAQTIKVFRPGLKTRRVAR